MFYLHSMYLAPCSISSMRVGHIGMGWGEQQKMVVKGWWVGRWDGDVAVGVERAALKQKCLDDRLATEAAEVSGKAESGGWWFGSYLVVADGDVTNCDKGQIKRHKVEVRWVQCGTHRIRVACGKSKGKLWKQQVKVRCDAEDRFAGSSERA